MAAVRSIPEGSLTADERARNVLGQILVFITQPDSQVRH